MSVYVWVQYGRRLEVLLYPEAEEIVTHVVEAIVMCDYLFFKQTF